MFFTVDVTKMLLHLLFAPRLLNKPKPFAIATALRIRNLIRLLPTQITVRNAYYTKTSHPSIAANAKAAQPSDPPKTPGAPPVNVAGVGVAPAPGWVELEEFPAVDTFPIPPIGAQSSSARAIVAI